MTAPRTLSSSATRVAMRPPIDLPPMNSRGPPPSSATASRQVLSSSGSRSGAPRLPPVRRAAMYGNSKRTTRMPRSPSSRATVVMNGVSMAPPAPWANTYTCSAASGPSVRNIGRSLQSTDAPAQLIYRSPSRRHRRGRCEDDGTADHPPPDGDVPADSVERRQREGDLPRFRDRHALLPRRTLRRDGVRLRRERGIPEGSVSERRDAGDGDEEVQIVHAEPRRRGVEYGFLRVSATPRERF